MYCTLYIEGRSAVAISIRKFVIGYFSPNCSVQSYILATSLVHELEHRNLLHLKLNSLLPLIFNHVPDPAANATYHLFLSSFVSYATAHINEDFSKGRTGLCSSFHLSFFFLTFALFCSLCTFSNP